MHQKVTTKRVDLLSGMNISAYYYIGAFPIEAGDDQLEGFVYNRVRRG